MTKKNKKYKKLYLRENCPTIKILTRQNNIGYC